MRASFGNRRCGAGLIPTLLLLGLCLCATRCRAVECRQTDVSCSPLGALLYSGGALAFVTPVAWTTFAGGAGNDAANRVIQLRDNGYVIVGQSAASFGSPITPFGGISDMAIVRVDSNGVLLWNTFAGGGGQEIAYGVTEASNGDIVVTGSATASFGAPLNAFSAAVDMAIVRLNANGTQLWNTFLGGASNESGQAIAATTDGGVVVAGPGASNFGVPINAFAGGTDFAVVKYDANGARLWNTFLGAGNAQDAYSISVAANGDVLVSGVSNENFGAPITASAGGQEFLVARFNASGGALWHTFAGGAGNDFPGTGAATADGGYVLPGRSDGTWGTPVAPYLNADDGVVAKFDSAGTREWHTFHGSAVADIIQGAVQARDGSYCAAGTASATFGTPLNPYNASDDIFALNLSASGTLNWLTFYGSIGIDGGGGVAAATDGGCLFVGRAVGTFGAPINPHVAGEDFALIKLFANGTL